VPSSIDFLFGVAMGQDILRLFACNVFNGMGPIDRH
jgi:hypothetical protein